MSNPYAIRPERDGRHTYFNLSRAADNLWIGNFPTRLEAEQAAERDAAWRLRIAEAFARYRKP